MARSRSTLSRRAFLRSSGAAVGVALGGPLAAQDRFNQDSLLDFWPLGKITLMHIGPLLGEMMPHYQRPPEVRIGVGEAAGKVPYLTGEAFRIRYGIGGRTPMDYAFTHEHFVEHARAYGKMGGVDRVATVLNAIRAQRPGALFFNLQNDFRFGLRGVRSSDRLNRHAALKADVIGLCAIKVDPQNENDPEKCVERFKRGEATLEVVRHSGNTQSVQRGVTAAQERGVDLIVCLSWMGFESCRQLAKDVPELDIIFSESNHALPDPEVIGKTRIFASGSQGRFVTRIDVQVKKEDAAELEYKLIPMFSDLITPDPQVASILRSERAPFLGDLQHVVGRTNALLYRRGTLSSTWDNLICAALMAELDADIALVAGERRGRDILPGQEIKREDLFAVSGSAYVEVLSTEMTGAAIKQVLEKAAQRSFALDPQMRHNRDMLRAGGLIFELDVEAPSGARIDGLRMWANDEPLGMDRTYRVAHWGMKPDEDGGAGPPFWEVLESYISKRGRIDAAPVSKVTLKETN